MIALRANSSTLEQPTINSNGIIQSHLFLTRLNQSRLIF